MVRKEMVRKEMSTKSRQTAFMILWNSPKQENGMPKPGVTREVAERFDVDRRTILRQWHAVKLKIDEYVKNHNDGDGDPVDVDTLLQDVSFFASGAKNRKRPNKYKPAELQAAVRNLRLSDRRSFRVIASNLDVPTSTIHAMAKKGLLKRHSSKMLACLEIIADAYYVDGIVQVCRQSHIVRGAVLELALDNGIDVIAERQGNENEEGQLRRLLANFRSTGKDTLESLNEKEKECIGVLKGLSAFNKKFKDILSEFVMSSEENPPEQGGQQARSLEPTGLCA